MASPESKAGSAAAVPLIEELTREGSEAILARNQVGRLAYNSHSRVNVVPVHYAYDKGWIYGRTAPGGKLVQILRNRSVAFEVDEHSALFDWRSVVVHGTLYRIDRDASDAENVYDKAIKLLQKVLLSTLSNADPVPFRSQLFRIHVAEITGRLARPTGGTLNEASGEETVSDLPLARTDVELRDAATSAVTAMFAGRGDAPHVDVMEGVIILTGTIGSEADRTAVERAILAIPSARVVVNDVEIDSVEESHADPIDVARSAVRELAGFSERGNLKVVIENGWLRAEGNASPDDHTDVLRRLRGVTGARGLVDRIQPLPQP